ncbi:MAG: hypothetical protein FWE33_04340 [Defluviitaleaceae bacterium]|nr:hypothetical protein [Defluviitaleaceae bacterium]
MESFINMRQNLIDIYKKYEIYANYVLKFLAGLVIFWSVSSVGLYREEFSMLFNGATGVAFIVLLALIFSVSPSVLSLVIVAIVVALQLSLVLEVAVFVFLLLLLIIVFYARLAPKQCMLILAVVFAFYLRVPYAVVLFSGLYFGMAAIVPIILGVAVWSFIPFFIELARNRPPMLEFDLVELPTSIMEVFNDIYASLTTDISWVIVGFVFAMMILAVHLISLLSINRSRDIALGVGAGVGLICMLMVVAITDVDLSILGVFVGSIVSFGLVWVVKFFDKVKDYSRVEHVRFDDDDAVYYVKIVPKVKASSKKN